MGTPNNPPAKTAEEVLRGIIVYDPQHRQLREQDAHAFGIDVEVLESIYDRSIRPILDFWTRYSDLRQNDPIYERDKHASRGSLDSWEDLLGRYGLREGYGQVRQIFMETCWRQGIPQREPANIKICVFLTRKGHWLMWAAEGSFDWALSNETIVEYDTPRQLCEAFERIAGDDFQQSHGTTGQPQRFPLRIAQRLKEILANTVDDRTGRLNRMTHAQSILDEQLTAIRF